MVKKQKEEAEQKADKLKALQIAEQKFEALKAQIKKMREEAQQIAEAEARKKKEAEELEAQ